MGSDRPKRVKPETPILMSLPLLLIGGAFLLLAIALVLKTGFKGEDNTPRLSPKEEEKLQKRLKEIDEAEQYALIANEDGWYPCNHPGRATFYLKAGEVWKYGTTTKGQFGRYSLNYMEEINVFYFIQFKGSIAECLKEEQRKLYNYPYLPENLARPVKDRLPRPPYNSKMQ